MNIMIFTSVYLSKIVVMFHNQSELVLYAYRYVLLAIVNSIDPHQVGRIGTLFFNFNSQVIT
jgi:hypothetical protein